MPINRNIGDNVNTNSPNMTNKESPCPKCKTGVMGSGFALTDDIIVYGTPDFPGQTDMNGQTVTLKSSGTRYPAEKCDACGYSRFADHEIKPTTPEDDDGC